MDQQRGRYPTFFELGKKIYSVRALDSTVVVSKWANVVAGAGSVRSSAGTYTACTEVIDPFWVVVILSWRAPRSVARVGW
jgi:hypothetical protein